MLLSYSKKFIFIHIDKTAGTSVKDALSKYCLNPEESLYCTLLKKIGARQYSDEFYDHIRSSELARYLDPKIFHSFFKFAFVRNPWDWMLSSYTYYLKKPEMHPHVYFKNEIQSFRDFVIWQTRNPYIYHTQSEFLFDQNGNRMVDFIGKFENVDTDFKLITERLNIKEKLPHKNISKEKGYIDEYTDETKDLVYRFYKNDIKLFDYEF